NADLVTAPVPDRLKVGLGRTLKLGDLEVTPLRVERRKVRLFDERYPKPTELEHDSLLLHLRLHNASGDLAFAPLDNYFDRRWNDQWPQEKKNAVQMPFTQLEIGGERFYGGPCEWVSLVKPPRRRPGQSER